MGHLGSYADLTLRPLVFIARKCKPAINIAVFSNHLSTGARRAKRSVIRMLVIVVALFTFCWLPYHILVLYDNFAGQRDINPVFLQMVIFSLWLSFANSCCNPVVYAVLNRNYRREFGRLLRFVSLEVTYQTRETVFHRDIQTQKWELKIRHPAECFLRDSRYLDSR